MRHPQNPATPAARAAPREPPIISRYRDYMPPVDVERPVRALLAYLPREYLAGLKYVVLTNSGSSRRLRRGKTLSRGRSVAMRECGGFYHGDHIELLVDNLLAWAPRWMVRWSVTRTILLGAALYHEVGHHLHSTRRPVHREREDVADAWGRSLLRQFVRKRYWYLRPLWPLMSLVRGILADRNERSWLHWAAAFTLLCAVQSAGLLWRWNDRHWSRRSSLLLDLAITVALATGTWLRWAAIRRAARVPGSRPERERPGQTGPGHFQ